MYHVDKDRLVGHDYPGLHGPQFTGWEADERELGARVAACLDLGNHEQTWEALHETNGPTRDQ